MKTHQVVVVMSIPCPNGQTFEKATQTAKKIVEDMNDNLIHVAELNRLPAITMNVETYCEYDDAGQRVYYLHPKNKPIDL